MGLFLGQKILQIFQRINKLCTMEEGRRTKQEIHKVVRGERERERERKKQREKHRKREKEREEQRERERERETERERTERTE